MTTQRKREPLLRLGREFMVICIFLCWNRGEWKTLSGIPDEVGISRARESTVWNPNAEELQLYIEMNVRIGDILTLRGVGAERGRGIFLSVFGKLPREIGYTSQKSGAGSEQDDLFVSANIDLFNRELQSC